MDSNEEKNQVAQELKETFAAEIDALERSMDRSVASLERQLSEMNLLLKKVSATQFNTAGLDSADQLDPEKAFGGKTRMFAAHDDMDLQISEVKDHISRQTKHWRLYENFFYGIVIFLLLANFAMICWVGLVK